jgi:alkylated DNA repair protein alkB family protein 1
MLGGHLDDVEETMDQPIVSVSFGSSAIFLIGDQTKETEPIPILIQSGDVVIMSGKSRTFVHGTHNSLFPLTQIGVPQIVNGSFEKTLQKFEKEISGKEAEKSEIPDDVKEKILKYLHHSRVNFNVRQVYK